jgi:uncharacterized protein (TIGR01777 family)
LKVVIAGGTGFIGSALVQEFADRGDDVIVLSRSPKPIQNASPMQWDGKTVGPWAEALEGAGAVINVVGESVFTHWTEEKKERMMSSRVEPTKAIGQAIARCKKPPAIWINASAVGYYGSIYNPANEWSPAGDDFLAEVCKNWEQAQETAETPKTKKCQIRIGFVLGKNGGAFPVLKKLTASFLGSAIGSGKQFVAWIHVKDLAGSIAFCVDRQLEGPVNLVGPHPITNEELMANLRRLMHRPWVPKVPKFVLSLGSTITLPPPEVTLASQNVFPERLQALEYQYRFPNLDSALKDLLNDSA